VDEIGGAGLSGCGRAVTAAAQALPMAAAWPPSGEAEYGAWRRRKLALAAQRPEFIEIADLAQPSPGEVAALKAACDSGNMAFFRAAPAGDDSRTARALSQFVRQMGLRQFEQHRSATAEGVVPIEVSQQSGRAGFIPYSDKALNWHTDGYYAYRSPQSMIRSMALYCVRSAAEGGENEFLDPDIAYIRLRDADPRFVEALSHPQALTIPDFGEEGGGHGAVTGPVFVSAEGRLSMRYTIRKRHVVWRDDPLLDAARDKLGDVLASDPAIVRARLSPGEGILCNNVLHNRSAFHDRDGQGRLMLRVRSYQFVGAA
jgi:alpha-ketoglutarate-dependent taurine dioxygenase